MEASTTPQSRQRRSDARRNIEAILDAAGRLLAATPTASMQEIAAAAGVHRATVHRHFASKEALLRAVREHALDAFIALLEEYSDLDAPPDVVLRQVTEAVLRHADRYRTYRYTPSFDDLSEARAGRFSAASEGVLGAALRSGAVRTDLSPPELLTAWGGLILVSAPHIAAGRWSLDQATDFVLRVLAPKT